MNQIKLLIVDDNEIFLNGLKNMLELKCPDFHVKGTAENGRAALDFLEKHSVDIVLLDIKMPVLDGMETARIIKTLYPKTIVIMLTTFNELKLIKDCIAAGAAGYLLKDNPIENLISAIKSSLTGNIQFSSEAAYALTAGESATSDIMGKLSHREQEVLLCLARGMNNQEIADELFISEGTVRNYVSNIYRITNIYKRSQLIEWIKKTGIL